jgi:hypothetical protein
MRINILPEQLCLCSKDGLELGPVASRRRQPSTHLTVCDLLHLREAVHDRWWHKADMPVASVDVRFRGVKRTKFKQDALSAYDPKRTKTGLKSRSAAGSAPTFPSATASSGLSRWSARAHNRETGR